MGAAFLSSLHFLPPWSDFFPPTPEAYAIYVNIFQYFPLLTILQWLLTFYPAGKTSLSSSRLNIPGRIAWFTMEITGPLNLLYILRTLPPQLNLDATSLPLPNKLVAALYLLHYANRAIVSPFFAAPSMSPIHVLVAGLAVWFNWFNSACLASWLVGYAIPVVRPGSESQSSPTPPATLLPIVGLALFFAGMLGNIYSERTLFRLRREEADRRAVKKSDLATGSSASTPSTESTSTNIYHKVYVIPPPAGVFRSVLYPHYVFEWLEWLGFALVGTAVVPFPYSSWTTTPPASMTMMMMTTPPVLLAPWLRPTARLAEILCVPLPLPAVVFFVNAVANMLPHARWGRKWYVRKFGEDAVNGRGAVVPWCRWM